MIRRFCAGIALALSILSAPVIAQTDIVARGLAAQAKAQLADPRIRSAEPTLRQVTNRTGVNNSISGSNTRQGWRSWQVSYTPIRSLKICRWNGYVNSAVSGVETGAGGPLTWSGTVEYPSGVFTRYKFAGSNSGVTADNAWGCSDELAINIPAAAKFRLCGDDQYLSGGRVMSLGWSNTSDRSSGDEYQPGTTQDYCETSTVIGSTLAQTVMPQLVLGRSDRQVWGVVGDSIAAGVEDRMFSASGGRGLFGRSLAKFGPHLNYGVPGDRATWAAGNYTRRLAMLQAGGVSSVILQLGVNDLNNGRTSTQLRTDRGTIRGFFPGINVYDSTLTPTTATTDQDRTAANQTPASATNNTQRITFNDLLRNGIIGQAGVIDVASMVETSAAFEYGPVLNGGVWIPECMTNGDGIHPNSPCIIQRVTPLVDEVVGNRR